MKKALITGITGQDGGYLAELLLDKNYEVWGMHRYSSGDSNLRGLEHLEGKLKLVWGDLLDNRSLEKVIDKVMPDEVYNLAAQSHVAYSFDAPDVTKLVNFMGVVWLLDILSEKIPDARFYQASTSEMFGNESPPQNEDTLFKPVSPYAIAKLEAHEFVQSKRKRDFFASNGILFNHESPRRGYEFITRKVTDGLSRIKLGLPQRKTGESFLELGNLEAKRDWGFAGDYVEAMWLMLQQDEPDDYVIATGENHTVRELVETTAEILEIELNWQGEGVNEVGLDKDGREIIRINREYFRPVEVEALQGDSSRARKVLGWEPKTNFQELVKKMALADRVALKERYRR